MDLSQVDFERMMIFEHARMTAEAEYLKNPDDTDVPLPEEPDTDDETKIKKWKWKVKTVRKENRERHSQRCDIELKLVVARKMKDEEGFYYPRNLDF